MRHFHGAFTGTRLPRIRKTVRVSITGSDGIVLRAFEVSLVEDTELAAAIAVGEMVTDFAGEEHVTDTTVATALAASLASDDADLWRRFEDARMDGYGGTFDEWVDRSAPDSEERFLDDDHLLPQWQVDEEAMASVYGRDE